MTSPWDTPARDVILLLLAAFAGQFLFVWLAAARQDRRQGRESSAAAGSALPPASRLATGFVTDFLDTLGIGSFATTTAIFKLARMVPDEQIPGTMNVGHTLPTVLEAFIFIRIIRVDLLTLAALIAAAVAGAWWGAGIVARLPRRSVQLGMGVALAAGVVFMAMSQLGWFPAGGESLLLRGWPLALGVAGTCVFGALSTLGVGFYAPAMILVSLLGMVPLAAFPIMMGSAAFLMPVASRRFVQSRAYEPRAAAGLTLGGLPAVLLAAFLVKSLPLGAVRLLVLAVASWAAFLLFRSAGGASRQASRQAGG
jgi:uncharacterized membrane protein YfcA